jgi:hypothetical protein
MHEDTPSSGTTSVDPKARTRRIQLIAERVADTHCFTDRTRDRFVRTVTRALVFEPQVAAAGTVMEPSRARNRQFWRAIHESRTGLAAALLVGLIIFSQPIDWPAALILTFLVGFYSLLFCAIKILQWRSASAAAYAALPPPGSIMLADPSALTVNGIVIPWDKVVLETISLRWLASGFTTWRSSECIDRIGLIANGTPLALDRGVMTDGQDLLDTICDKLDLSVRPAPLGDVIVKGLPLYPRQHPIAGWPPTGATMTTFDKREEGFEKKFAHDEELRFKANARRNKLLGLWAAEKLGLAAEAANAYAKDVVMADFEEGGDNDVFKKVRKDFDDKKVAQSDQQIRAAMNDLMEKAIAEIKSK